MGVVIIFATIGALGLILYYIVNSSLGIESLFRESRERREREGPYSD